MSSPSTTRSGRMYVFDTAIRPVRTNLRYDKLLQKSVQREDAVVEAGVYAINNDRDFADAFASPTTLSPVTTSPSSSGPSSPSPSPVVPTTSSFTPGDLIRALGTLVADDGGDLPDASFDDSNLPDALFDYGYILDMSVGDRSSVEGFPDASAARSNLTTSAAPPHPGAPDDAAPSASRKRRASRNAKMRARLDAAELNGVKVPQNNARMNAKKLSSKRRRGKERQELKARAGSNTKRHRATFAGRYSKPNVLIVEDFDAVDYKVTKGAYTVKRLGTMERVPWTEDELDENGFRTFEWDGFTPYAILDSEDRIIAVLVGRPKDGDSRSTEETWLAAMARLAAELEAARTAEGRTFTSKQVNHRRGDFAAVSFGPSYGGGQTEPMNLSLSKDHKTMVDALRANVDLQRVAGYGSEALAAYFPKAYDFMRTNLDVLYRAHPKLEPNFLNSAYPTMTLNLGPDTTCIGHNDCSNFPSLACAITALGGFNPDEGGHMVFWDLGLKVRFPPGSTILLSSAGMRHGNLPIRPGEHRYSVTQYCPGGLMRWTRHGMKPAYRLSKAERARLDGVGGEGWQTQLSRLSKYKELVEDRQWLLEQEAARAAA